MSPNEGHLERAPKAVRNLCTSCPHPRHEPGDCAQLVLTPMNWAGGTKNMPLRCGCGMDWIDGATGRKVNAS